MRPDSRLSYYPAIAYTLLAIYASLYPFSDWRDSGAPLLAFLEAAWPRYYTGFDLTTNVLAYLPLGFFWGAALQSRLPRWAAWIAAALFGTGISLAMETLQNYLPSRVPSNVDLACNGLGTLLGAYLGIGIGRTLITGGRLHRLRQQWVIPGEAGEMGLVLLGLWLLTQLNPEILLFGCGDLRHLLGLESSFEFDATHFSRIETAIAAANTFAVGLIAAELLTRRHRPALVAFLLSALVVRTFAAALLVAPAQALRWLTPGNSQGLVIGLLALIPVLWLVSPLRRILAGSALLIATVLVNLAPENPYLALAAQVWSQGHFLNFNGLTRLASMLWPFLALPWLMLPKKPGASL